MKTRLILVLIIVLTTLSAALGQQKMALFLHGFEGDADSWLSANTPQQWVSEGIVDGYVNFTYRTTELAPDSLVFLFSKFANTLNTIDFPNTEWVIVAHSLGGFVSRLGYNQIKSNPLTQHINIKAILTLGTPHQGARATGVSLSPYSTEHIYVKPVFDEFEYRMLQPLSEVHSVVGFITGLTNPDALGELQNAPLHLKTIYGTLAFWEQASILNNAKALIGVDGSVINAINSPFNHQPQYRRSIIGAEKKFIPVRSASENLDIPGSTELSTLNNFDQIRWFYMANRNAWNAEVNALNLLTWPFPNPFAAYARAKRDRWQRGRDAMDNLDVSWGQIIDSYKIVNTYSYGWMPIGSCGGNGGPVVPGEEIIPDTECLGGVLYEYTQFTVTTLIPEKNDAVVSPSYAVWSSGQQPNDQVINYLYDDVPAEGGYNHFEIKRYRRAYALQDVFQVGDLAPPMEDGANWVRFTVFGGQ